MPRNALLTACVLFSAAAFAQTLESNFHSPVPVRAARVMSIVTQPDGKHLVGGDVEYFGTQRVRGLIRLNADGTIDNTFALPVTEDIFVREIKFQSNGNIVVLTHPFLKGNSVQFGESIIYILGPNGQLVQKVEDLPGFSTITVQADNKVLLAGGPTLTRLNADLTADAAFNDAVSFNNWVADVEQFGTSLIVAGQFTEVNGVPKNDLVKLDLDGNVDNSFDTGTGTSDAVGSISIQPDGKILIGNTYINSFNGVAGTGTIRLNANGSVDSSFQPFRFNGPVSGIFLFGSDIYASAFIEYNNGSNTYFFKMASNGSLDVSFTPVLLPFASFFDLVATNTTNGIVINNTDKTFNAFGVAKFGFTGTPVTTFKPKVGRFGIFKQGSYVGNKLAIAGDFLNVDGHDTNGVVKLNLDGTVDTGFSLTTNLGAGLQVASAGNGNMFFSSWYSFVKLNSTGSILPDFTWSPFKTLYGIGKFILLENGKIQVMDSNNTFRLNANGSEDTSFDIGSGIGGGVSTQGDMDIQDDKVVYGSRFDNFNGTTVNALVRLKENADLDASFGIGTGPAGPNKGIGLVKVVDTNEILIGGYFNSFNGVSTPTQLVKLSEDGVLDLAFNENQQLGQGPADFGVNMLSSNQNFVRLIGSRVFIGSSEETLSNLYVVNPDGTRYDDFIIPADVNEMMDIIPPVGTQNPTVSSTVFALGSFDLDNQVEPAPIIKMTMLVAAGQTISFNALPDKPYASAPFNLTATSSSGLPVSYTSSNPDVATVSGSTVTVKALGTTVITARQLGNENFTAAKKVSQILTVVQAQQVITFEPLDLHKVTDGQFQLVATTTSGLPITFVCTDGRVAEIDGSTVTITGVGIATISATQEGNENYLPADDVAQTLIVNKGGQVITFAELQSRTVGDSPFTLTATSTAGLAVAFSTTSDEITISGKQVTLVKAGKATIRATQAGDDSYDTATPVDQTFCVNPAKPTITAGAQVNSTITLTSSANTGNQWYRNGSPIEAGAGNTYAADQSGSYTVKVIVEDCASAVSDPAVLTITGVGEYFNSSSLFYPNPVSSTLYIDLSSFEVDTDVEVTVYNTSGNRVENMRARKSAELAVDSYSTGIYFLRASQNGTILSAKFIKQ